MSDSHIMHVVSLSTGKDSGATAIVALEQIPRDRLRFISCDTGNEHEGFLPYLAYMERIHYTDRKAKRPFMEAKGLRVQVWIDDRPEFVLMHAAPRSLKENAASGIWADANQPRDLG